MTLFLQKDAEASLAEALPALEAARIALEDLDKSDVTEIRWVMKIILSNSLWCWFGAILLRIIMYTCIYWLNLIDM